MKKLIIAFLLVAVVATLAFAIFIQGRLSKTDVAALLPGETMALIHFPDVSRSRDRWKQTALFQILHEPEVMAFLERPSSKVPKLTEGRAERNRLLALEPQEAFLAVPSLAGSNNIPKVVAGFSYKGKKADVETLLADAKKQLLKAFPDGKSDLIAYKNLEIETFTASQVTLAGAFAKQWYFLSDDLDLLKSTLDRFNGSKSDDSLRKNKKFASSMVRMAPQPDTLLFVQPKELIDRITGLLAATGQPANPQFDEMRKIEAISATTKFEGDQVRDTMFVLKPGLDPHPPLARNSLALTSSNTLLYYAALANFATGNIKLPDPALDATGMLGKIADIGKLLEAQGLSWADFSAAFGPEMAVSLDWPAIAPQPALSLALDVRDSAKANKIVETLTAAQVGGTIWSRQLVDATPYYAMQSSGIALITPTLAVTDKFLLIGLNLESVKSAVARIKTAGDKVSDTPGYQKAAETVNKPTAGFGYVAAKPLFERVYGTLRPLAIMWAAFAPKASDYVDVNKLPTTESISKHLGPIVYSGSANDQGVLSESVGPVTFGQASVLLGAGIGAAAVPMLKARFASPASPPMVQPNATPEPAASPAEEPIPSPGAMTPAPAASPSEMP